MYGMCLHRNTLYKCYILDKEKKCRKATYLVITLCLLSLCNWDKDKIDVPFLMDMESF